MSEALLVSPAPWAPPAEPLTAALTEQLRVALAGGGADPARVARDCAEQLAGCLPGPSLVELLTLLADPAVPSDGLLDEAVLASWERVRAWVESQFYAAVTAFAGRADPDGIQLERVRCALGLSRQGAANVILVARRLLETFPTTMSQLQAGRVTHRHVWALVDTTRLLSEEEAGAVERATCADAPEQTMAEYRRALDRARAIAAPDHAERAVTARVVGRGVSRWTDRDGQPKLLANLPPEDLAAAWEALCARAEASRQPADPRGHAARMADALTEALTGQPAAYDPRRHPATPATPEEIPSLEPSVAAAGAGGASDVSDPSATAGTPAAPRSAPALSAPIEIHVIVPAARISSADTAEPRPSSAPSSTRRGRVLTSRGSAAVGIDSLLGRASLPGELTGSGWVPASLIRRLAQGEVRLRRLVVDAAGRLLDCEHTVVVPAGRSPDAAIEAELLSAPYQRRPFDYGSSCYRPPPPLRRFIVLRDRTCQVPGCGQPAWRSDIDHAIPFPLGPTSAGNCGALCRRHHRLKTHFGWQLVRLPTGETLWISPEGLARLRRAYSYLRFLS